MTKKLLPLLLAVLLLTSCSLFDTETATVAPTTAAQTPDGEPTLPPHDDNPTALPDPTDAPLSRADELLSDMDLEAKVRQLFFITLGDRSSTAYAQPSDTVSSFVDETQAGGYILFPHNISTREGTRALTDAVKQGSAITPFIGIDEEGGLVSRLYSAKLPGYKQQPKAATIGASGDTAQAYTVGDTIGSTLAELGITVDFAPDADVLTEPKNTVIGSRSFGSDPQLVSEMVSFYSKGLRDNGVLYTPKHFPGHGGTVGDSHNGFVSIAYDEDHLNSVEYVPFKRAIAENTPFILVGHITDMTVDPSGLPATLSPYFITEVLRGQLGFDGLIITDAMDMGAIVENYDVGGSAVMALQAGIDILLMPQDFDAALSAVLDAVDNGKLTEQRIDESVRRILQTKLDAGIIS